MEKNSGKGKAKEKMDFQGYGLRDYPKKSWKSLGFADDHTTTASSMLKFQCKACGKEFESMKALFGHMRHHSGREKKGARCQGFGRKFQSLKALTGHNMRLHPVKQLRVIGESGPGGLRQQDLVLESITVKRKRSKRMRYNNAPNSSLSSLNESSSGVAEFDQEMEDAALCLIMLSKGSKNWIEFNNSFLKSCDNNSEIKSLHQNQEIMQNENGGSFQVKKPRVDKSDSAVSATVNIFHENNICECKELDSGIMINKVKKVGSEAPNDMPYGGVESRRMSKVDDDESGLELYDSEIEERISGQDLLEGLNLAGLGSTESCSCKDHEMLDAYDDAEPGGDSLNKLISTPSNSEISDDSRKKNKYKCRICSKTFKSHQALGGHQTIHRKSYSSAVERIEDSEKITQSCSSPEIEASRKLVKVKHVENSVEQEMNGVTSYGTKGNKVYECRICFKVFASGQALGGHRRSHILKDPETSDKQPAKQLEFLDIYDVIDLNLPVMHNEEANGDIGFKLCRLGSDRKSKALVSLVANR